MPIAIYGMCLANKKLISNTVILKGKLNKIDLLGDFSGKMYNVSLILSSLKDEVHFITKIGNDDKGLLLENKLQKHLIFVYPILVSEQTPYLFNINDLEKQLTLTTNTKNFEFCNDDSTYHLALQNCTVGLIDSDNIKYIEKVIKNKPYTRWILTKPVLDESILNAVYGMIINRQDLLQISLNSNSIEHSAKALLLKGLNFIILTLDKEGFIYYDINNSRHFPINCDNVKNIQDIDDYFIAGFISQMSIDYDMNKSIKKGVQLATNHK